MSTLTVTNITSANATTDLTISTGNSSAGKFVLYSNNSGLAYSNSSANLIVFSLSGSTIGAGFAVTAYNVGVTTAGQVVTPNAYNGNYQYMTANSTWTLNTPTNDCAIDILVTNGTGAGAITVNANYTAATGGGGDPYATTSGNKYYLMIRRINSVSTYSWQALQ